MNSEQTIRQLESTKPFVRPLGKDDRWRFHYFEFKAKTNKLQNTKYNVWSPTLFRLPITLLVSENLTVLASLSPLTYLAYL